MRCILHLITHCFSVTVKGNRINVNQVRGEDGGKDLNGIQSVEGGQTKKATTTLSPPAVSPKVEMLRYDENLGYLVCPKPSLLARVGITKVRSIKVRSFFLSFDIFLHHKTYCFSVH